MASTSASSVQRMFKYDVFLSFRGEDVRKTFVDHLYLALTNKGIITYKDNEEIEKGVRISEQLIRSIEESRFYIIVFSKNYASSSWCLDELVKIMECQKRIEHTAYPIFYDVEPTDVRKQSGSVGEAFAKHVEAESVGRWIDALKEAADLAGWELKNTLDGHEAKFIEKIMEEILRKLYFINLSIDQNLVGMEIRVNKIISSLEIGFEDVRMIGIKGIGGGGKTTLATAVFDHVSFRFEGISFIENVREVSKSSLSGLKELQKQLLSDVLNDQSIVIRSISDGKNKLKKVMGSRKVLVVLDDVDNVVQLEALAGNPSWFKPGSRIIITTRDEQVLVSHRANFIHDLNLLSHHEAICLFSRYAFEREIPIQGYGELADKVVQYAAGLPLTIKVLGSFLCGKSKHEWIDAIRRLETIPLKETLEKLELSYNDLDNDHKEILLYVACILKGEAKDKTIRVLKSCGFHAEIGLKVLKQKSLLTISVDDRLQLHDHIQEMGMNIIRRLHPEEPNKHNLLWIKEEIEDILVNDLGTEATRSIKLGFTLLHPTIIMKGLKKMKELRLLYMTRRYSYWKFDEAGEYLPNTLQCLDWPWYPFSCLPKTFQANKLVNLEMQGSNISQLWEGGERKVLKNLKFLDLQSSKLRTFDLGMTPNLETLNLQRCSHFVELYIPVKCPMLKSLNLSGTKLSNLSLGLTPNLEWLYLERCEDFVELHMLVKCTKLKYLNLHGSKLSNFNLGLTPYLERLDLRGCNHFVELNMPIEHPMLNFTYLYLCGSKVTNLNLVMTPNIKIVDLKGCKDLVELHMPDECPSLESLDLGGSKVCNLKLRLTPNLEKLNLGGCNDLIELCMPDECPNLESLDLTGSKVCNLNLGLTPNLKKLNLGECNELVELHMPVECPNLEYIDLSGSKVHYLDLGLTQNLQKLDLRGCNHLVELYMPAECPNLKYFDLSGSKVSKLNLALTPHLERLNLKECDFLQEIHAPMGCLKEVVYLNLSGCLRFESFVISMLHAVAGPICLAMLKLCVESVHICPLHPNDNLPKFQFICKYVERLPSLSGNIEKLLSFGLCACTNLESFSACICDLQRLGKLTLEGSIPEVPKDLGQLESLEELSLWMKEIRCLPDSICMLKHLKSLDLSYCLLLEQLPKNLGILEDLVELHLSDCKSLRDIPNSICNIKSLKYLDLRFCILLEKLPEEFGRLESLEEINIENAGISRLPQSIFELKGLYIVGSRWRLESYGFTSLKEISTYTASCYIRDLQHESPL